MTDILLRDLPNERDQGHDGERNGDEVEADFLAVIKGHLMDGCARSAAQLTSLLDTRMYSPL